MNKIVLHQFPYSNFCEKVAWAFDWKGIVPDVQEHLPMLHMKKIRRLSGQTAVPVIETTSKGVIAGSAAIIRHLEDSGIGRSLFPENPEQRNAALQWQAKLDDVGGIVRGAMFYDFLEDKSYFHHMLTGGEGSGLGYKIMFIAMSPMLRKKLEAVEPDPEVFRHQVFKMIDTVAEAAQETGYLVGNEFSIADLTAAALFFPLCFPDGSPSYDIACSSKAGERWLSRWAGHPVLDYIRHIYSAHRVE